MGRKRTEMEQAASLPNFRGLRAMFRAGQVIIDPIELLTYERDASLDRGIPDAAVFPETTDDVVKLVT